jgi:PAS domain S-box-containing protein
VILTHGDVDGVCAAAIAKTSYPKAEVEFTNPQDFVSKMDFLSKHDCVIILDLGIAATKEVEAQAAFQKLSKTSGIIYIDHHIRPPGLVKRRLACNVIVHKTGASTSELAWEFFKHDVYSDFIAVLGAVGDYAEKTPRMQGLIERYGERRVYSEALFLEWALMVAEDSFKRGVVEELVQGKWPYQMSIMGEEADYIIRRQRTLENYVKAKAEKICEHVMLVRDPPFKATGPAATILTDFDNVDVGLASRREENSVYLSLRRHKESDVNLASLIEESALIFGGAGGGHKAAAGGKIPANVFTEFLLEIRRRLPKEQLKRTRELDVEFIDTRIIKRKLFKEIIERERAEEELRESREKYKELVDSITDPFFAMGKDLKCTYWNKASEKLVEISEKDVIGKHIKDVFRDSKEIRGAINIYQDVLKKQRSKVFVSRYHLKGREYILEISAYPTKDGLSVFVKDITKLTRAEEKRIRAETEAEAAREGTAIIDAMGDGLVVVGMDGKITSVNPAYEKMMGYEKNEIVGEKAADLTKKNVKPEDLKTAMESLEASMKGEVRSPITITLFTKDGREVPVILTSSIMKDSEGKPSSLIIVFKDITEHKKAEDAVFKEQ